MRKDEYKNLNGGDLAFIGDAYFELVIRKHILDKGLTSLGKLHSSCVGYVSRDNQFKIVNELRKEFSEEEEEIFKRGRNYNYKNKTSEYINASGFEAVIGYLFLLDDKERLDYFIKRSIQIIES